MKYVLPCLACLAVVQARRLPSTQSQNSVDLKKMGALGWGYPYGWGLDKRTFEPDLEEHKTVKEVKSVKKQEKKGHEEQEHGLLRRFHYASELNGIFMDEVE